MAFVISFTSCKDDYLDINKNPNDATEASPELVLPAALNTTASLVSNTFNDYGAFIAGYQANAFGFSYVGSDVVTYNYTASSNTGLWTGVFGNLRNYQYIINNTQTPNYALFNAVARIMKSHNYQLLVDQYGDVPYTDALKGVDNLTPKYDKAEDVYKSLVTEIDAAIAILKANATNTTINQLGKADIFFAGNITRWIQFANSIKLRILVRAASAPSLAAFVNTAYGTFSSEGFITEDVVSNPGYSSSSANLNQQWTSIHSNYTGTAATAGRSRVPTPYAVGFYNGSKLTDNRRGLLVYRSLTAPLNQLGIEPATAAASAPTTGFPAWYIGTGTGTAAIETQGILKSRVAPTPILLAAEVNFLLAEAALTGRTLSGSDATNFNLGIVNSFKYLEKLGSTNTVPSTSNPTTDAATYQTNNAGSYLVNYALATTTPQKLEAIITQKYIALNYIHSHEAWNEYRRTGYPVTNPNGTAAQNMASVTSVSTRADKLPVRLLYPQSELNLNQNVPKGLNPFTSLIFWDAN